MFITELKKIGLPESQVGPIRASANGSPGEVPPCPIHLKDFTTMWASRNHMKQQHQAYYFSDLGQPWWPYGERPDPPGTA